MIEEPVAQIFKHARTAKIRADHVLEFMRERRHDASP